jgi:hypothetical protein
MAVAVNLPKSLFSLQKHQRRSPVLPAKVEAVPRVPGGVCYNPAVSPGRDDRPTAPPLQAHRHLRFGWWSLCLFGALGLILESLHGFKVRAYLDVTNDTRRLMWTLAHAHGTLLGLVHLAFAASLALFRLDASRLRLASTSLTFASILLPGGFFLAGIRFYAGDPGLGIVLVPIGAILLLLTAGLAALSVDVNPPAEPGRQERQSPARKS